MKKLDDEKRTNLVVMDGQHRMAAVREIIERTLDIYDATPHVGLNVFISHAAIERIDVDGEETIEVPKPDELRAAAAVARCLMPVKLRGYELKAIRKILGKTLAEFAKCLDERTAAETVSRWESETQPMGGYAEKMLRLYVCEELSLKAPGIAYNAKMISHLRVVDPWITEPKFVIPPIELVLMGLKELSGEIIEAYNTKRAA